MDNFDPERPCGCIPPIEHKQIEPCRSPGYLGYIMTVVLVIFLVFSFGETLWNSFVKIFQKPVCTNFGKKKKGTKTLMNNIEVWKSDQNIFGDSVKDRRHICNILYRNFIRNKCFTSSRLIELSNIDWEGIFHSLKKSLRITSASSESNKKPKDIDCETDSVSLTYLEKDKESNSAREDHAFEDSIDFSKKQKENLNLSKCVKFVSPEPLPIISGSPKSNSPKKRPKNKTTKAKHPFDSYKLIENDTSFNNNDKDSLDAPAILSVPKEKNENSRPCSNSKNEKKEKSVLPVNNKNLNVFYPFIKMNFEFGKKIKNDKNVVIKSESISSIKRSYVLPKAVYRKHLHPKCYTADEAIWKSNFRSKEANVGAINHVFRATEDDFDVVEIENEEFFQSVRYVRYYQCEFNGKMWEVSTKLKYPHELDILNMFYVVFIKF